MNQRASREQLLGNLQNYVNTTCSRRDADNYIPILDEFIFIAKCLDKGDNIIAISEEDLTESISLAMRAEGIEEEKILSATTTLMDAIANNLGD